MNESCGRLLSVNMNPTLQKTLCFNRLIPGEVNRTAAHRFDVAGKGLNTARVLSQLGKEVVYLTQLGGALRPVFLDLCKRDNINVHWVESGSVIRYCYTIISGIEDGEARTVTELVEEGEPVAAGTEERLFSAYTKLLPSVRTVIICGTKARGFSDTLIPEMVRLAREYKKQIILDIRGNDLKQSLQFMPDVIKPNLFEFTDTFTSELEQCYKSMGELSGDEEGVKENVASLALELARKYATKIVLSRGKNSVWYTEGNTFSEAAVEIVKPLNTTGCGDAFTAGLAAAINEGLSLKKAVELGIHCGSLNAGFIKPGTICENGKELPDDKKERYESDKKTLVPCKEESVDWETTQNIYIEGENLEALMLMQEKYREKIKMIYIDPPYNTGNKFVYNDSLLHHSAWCSMMYPRLMLARDLLCDSGAIFISIDDNEAANLKKICNEIFGETNFVACLNWNTKKAAQGMTTQNMIVCNHEYILVYAKDSRLFKFIGIDRDKNNGFSNPDNDPRGLWKRQYLQRIGQGLPKRELKDPDTGRVFVIETPYTQEKINRWIEEKRIIFPKNETQYPVRKEFLREYKNKQQLVTSLGLYATKATTEKLYSLFNNKKVFTNPKPETLIAFLVRVTTSANDIIMDFFSGSATTAHAVMQVNAEDGGQRQFIMVQMPEACATDSEAARLGYQTISEIGKERIRRAGKKIREDTGAGGKTPDIGFRVYKIAE
ncbi:MAG: PfkB family carbohydrate kinase [Treponema sp.]|nr:PfkB family carbohydrate kinase [Treponema sp.]